MLEQDLHISPLGQKSIYPTQYDCSLLFPIARQTQRTPLGIDNAALPFYGYDLWTGFELSWLNKKGKPLVAIADMIIPCASTHLLESKSLKLYLNSMNNTIFESMEEVSNTIMHDLSRAAGSLVQVRLYKVNELVHSPVGQFSGVCLDELDVACTEYHVNPGLLKTKSEKINEEAIYSHLLKSNCPVTGQPDWASVGIRYSGREIDEASFLQYIVSFRNHNGFHEECVERIFIDLMNHCHCEQLTVYAIFINFG